LSPTCSCISSVSSLRYQTAISFADPAQSEQTVTA
jgi:hypothetical protein